MQPPVPNLRTEKVAMDVEEITAGATVENQSDDATGSY
jgi:hypothetical protein